MNSFCIRSCRLDRSRISDSQRFLEKSAQKLTCYETLPGFVFSRSENQQSVLGRLFLKGGRTLRTRVQIPAGAFSPELGYRLAGRPVFLTSRPRGETTLSAQSGRSIIREAGGTALAVGNHM